MCSQNTGSSTEVCDGQDNDCDGSTDEGNPGGGGGCNTGSPGVCSAGTKVCSGGGIVCSQNTGSSTEICDGKDNDCDGSTDEGNPGGGQSCSTGQPGVCGAGITACSGGGIVCVQTQVPGGEICGNNLDDDCDGQTDEGCNDCATNLATVATGSHSGGGVTVYGPDVWNDGVTEAQCSSNCLGGNCFGWVTNDATTNGKWVQYSWPSTQVIGSMYVDAPACATSTCTGGRTMGSGTVQWWNGSSWQTHSSFSGNDGDRAFSFNPPLVTSRIRIYNIKTGACTNSTNTEIFEWYVWSGNGCKP